MFIFFVHRVEFSYKAYGVTVSFIGTELGYPSSVS